MTAMRKTLSKTWITTLLFAILTFVSGCEKALMDTDPKKFTNREIFESLWNTVNEKYSYLTYKDIDWDAIRAEYESKIDESTSS